MNLFIGLFLLLGASNAFILDAEDKLMERIGEAIEDTREVTLREYLDDLDKPDPVTRGAEDCKETCKKKKIASPEVEKCQKKKFKPNYEKDGCKCLIGYKCCPDTCPVRNWSKCIEGMTYGIMMPDCCGCEEVVCIECQKPETEEEICAGLKKPPACYTYREQGRKADDTECWESTCEENDPPKQQDCLFLCQTESLNSSQCGSYKTCKSKLIDECRHNDIESQKPSEPLHCYEDEKRVDDLNSGHFFDESSNKCAICQKYEWTKKSCEAKNKAAQDHDCNKDSIYDKSCINKSIKKDQCGCDEAVCTKLPEEKALFGNDVHCPKNYVRLRGEGLCGTARDICFPCPELQSKEQVQCDGTILDDKDINNCPTWSCLPEEKFTCNDNSRVSKKKLCDGNKDCKDGEDELNCNKSELKTSRFQHCFHFPDDECKAVEITPKNRASIEDFTIDVWYKQTKETSAPAILSATSSNNPLELMILTYQGRVGSMDADNIYDYVNLEVELDHFKRLTVTKKGTKSTIYINGKKKQGNDVYPVLDIDASSIFELGQKREREKREKYKTYSLFGSICDFQMWNKALTKAELGELFQKSTYSKVERGNVFDNPPSYTYEIKSCSFDE